MVIGVLSVMVCVRYEGVGNPLIVPSLGARREAPSPLARGGDFRRTRAARRLRSQRGDDPPRPLAVDGGCG
jgi:hypothetical protein